MKKFLVILFALLGFAAEALAVVWPQNVPVDTPKLRKTGQTTLTLSSDAVTVSRSYHKLAVEAGASDNLVTINGASAGYELTLEAADPTKPIYILRTGNVQGDADLALTFSAATLIYNGTKWVLPSSGGGTATAVTVTDTASATGYFGMFEDATGDIGPKTDPGARYDATTGSPTFTGTVTAGAFAVPKVDGIPGATGWYEANSTDVNHAGFVGPLSLSYSYQWQFPNTRATGRQMVVVTNTGETGTGTTSDPYRQPMSAIDDEDSISATFNGGGTTAIAQDTKAIMTVPFACIITGGQILASKALGTSGTVSIVVNIWREATPADYDGGNAHPAVTDKITASAPPTVTTANRAAIDPSTWGAGATLAKGDILVFNVDSVTDAVVANVVLYVNKI